MTKLEYIKKEFYRENNSSLDSWKLIKLVEASSFIAEIDEEEEIIITMNDENIHFDELKDIDIEIMECTEVNIPENILEFLKYVKKSIKFINKGYQKHGFLSSLERDENFLNDEYLETEWNNIFQLSEDIESGVKMFELDTIDKYKE